MSLDGLQLSHYRLLKLIGSGGMGEVYLAEDTHLHRQVAVKVVRIEPAAYPDIPATHRRAHLLQREAKAISMLDHPYILPLFDYGEENVQGRVLAYLVMPFRPEGSLVAWLRKRGNADLLSPKQVVQFIWQAASALQYAHDHGIIHQDVKLSNFLLRSKGEHSSLPDLLLADFGIAKLSSTTSSPSQGIRGTPTYMAPEQWKGHPVPASDQYALAVMAYELLTGRPPFEGPPMRMLYLHTNTLPQPPSILNSRLSPAIDAVILCALAKRPQDRFTSVSEFAQAFQEAVQGTNDSAFIVSHPKPARGTDTSTFIRTPTTPKISDHDLYATKEEVPPTPIGGNRTVLSHYSTVLADQGRSPVSNEPAVSISQSPPISQFPGTSSKGDREPSWVRRILLITVILLFLAGSALLIYSSAQGQMPTTNNHNNATGTALAQMHAASSSTAQAGETATAQSIALAQNKATATAVAQANAAANASATAAARGTATTVAQNNAEATAIAQANANGTATAQNNATATAIAQANANATATAIGQANATATAQANATATAVASQNPYPPHNGTLVLNDPLSDNSQGHHWDERTDCVFTGGAYHVSEAQQGYFNACYARSTNFSNFTYEVHMTIVQGDDSSSGGGIVFRTFDDVHTNLYALTIRLDGSYSLYVHNGSAGARLLASGSSSAIHTGLNQSNVIAVVANGSNIDLYVNDQQIDSVSDSTYSQGDIGVFTYNGGSGAEAVFSNAKVWTQ